MCRGVQIPAATYSFQKTEPRLAIVCLSPRGMRVSVGLAFKDALTRRLREEAGPTASMETSQSDDIRRAQGVGLDGTHSAEVKS